MNCEGGKLSSLQEGWSLSEVHRGRKKGERRGASEKEMEAETKADGDNRPTVGGTQSQKVERHSEEGALSLG